MRGVIVGQSSGLNFFIILSSGGVAPEFMRDQRGGEPSQPVAAAWRSALDDAWADRLLPGSTGARRCGPSLDAHAPTIRSSIGRLTALGPPPSDEEDLESVLSKSLLDRAGLQRKPTGPPQPEFGQRRYNPMDDSVQQMKRREYE